MPSIATIAALGFIGCRYAWIRESDPWRANLYHSAMLHCIAQSKAAEAVLKGE